MLYVLCTIVIKYIYSVYLKKKKDVKGMVKSKVFV